MIVTKKNQKEIQASRLASAVLQTRPILQNRFTGALKKSTRDTDLYCLTLNSVSTSNRYDGEWPVIIKEGSNVYVNLQAVRKGRHDRKVVRRAVKLLEQQCTLNKMSVDHMKILQVQGAAGLIAARILNEAHT